MIAQPSLDPSVAHSIENAGSPVNDRQPGPGERRRHQRVTALSIAVGLDDKSYTSLSWSLGGFIVDGYEGKLSPGALYTIREMALDGACPRPVTARSRVVRFEPPKRRLVVSFLDLDSRAYSLLQEVMSERMRRLKGCGPDEGSMRFSP